MSSNRNVSIHARPLRTQRVIFTAIRLRLDRPQLIHLLNPKIRSWANDYKHSSAKQTFTYVDILCMKLGGIGFIKSIQRKVVAGKKGVSKSKLMRHHLTHCMLNILKSETCFQVYLPDIKVIGMDHKVHQM